MAGTRQHPDDACLPGVGAGPCLQPGVGALVGAGPCGHHHKPKMAELCAKSATAEREPHKWLAGTYDDNAGDQEPSVLETSRSNVSIRTAAAGIANSNST